MYILVILRRIHKSVISSLTHNIQTPSLFRRTFQSVTLVSVHDIFKRIFYSSWSRWRGEYTCVCFFVSKSIYRVCSRKGLYLLHMSMELYNKSRCHKWDVKREQSILLRILTLYSYTDDNIDSAALLFNYEYTNTLFHYIELLVMSKQPITHRKNDMWQVSWSMWIYCVWVSLLYVMAVQFMYVLYLYRSSIGLLLLLLLLYQRQPLLNSDERTNWVMSRYVIVITYNTN